LNEINEDLNNNKWHISDKINKSKFDEDELIEQSNILLDDNILKEKINLFDEIKVKREQSRILFNKTNNNLDKDDEFSDDDFSDNDIKIFDTIDESIITTTDKHK
jgi:hypothetical protein